MKKCQLCGVGNACEYVCTECTLRASAGQIPVICTDCQAKQPSLPLMALTWIPPNPAVEVIPGTIPVLFQSGCSVCLPPERPAGIEVANA